MRYIGRLLSILLIVLSSFSWFISSTHLWGSLTEHWSRLTLFIGFEILYFIVGLRIGKAYDDAKFHSEKDNLTGVYNRRYLRMIFPKFIKKLKKNKEYLGVILIDIDHFKIINDNYGHTMGDLVLTKITGALKKAMRPTDLMGRWGGDEFILIIPITDRSVMPAFLNRLTTEIEKLNYLKDIKGHISASIGVAIYPSDADTLDNLIAIADKNMYLNKKQKKVVLNINLNQEGRSN